MNYKKTDIYNQNETSEISETHNEGLKNLTLTGHREGKQQVTLLNVLEWMDNRAETTDGKRVKSYLDQVEVVENHLHPERTWHIKENEELTIFKS